MTDHPLYGRPTSAHLRQTKWHPIDYESAYDPAVLISRRAPDREPIAEGGIGISRDVLLAAGFGETTNSGPLDREYSLTSGDPHDDLAQCARAVAAVAAADYPVTVAGHLFEPENDLLPHLSTAALIATVEGIQSLPGPADVASLTHCLLDPGHGLLTRVNDTLDTLRQRQFPRGHHKEAERIRRAAGMTTAATETARLLYALRGFHVPAKTTPATTRSAPNAALPEVELRDDNGLVVAHGADHTAARLLERAGFAESAFAPDRHQLPPDSAEWLVQKRCTQATRLLTAIGHTVHVDPGLLAGRNSHLGPWMAPAIADVVDRLRDDVRTDTPTLTHLLLDHDGTVQRVRECLDELAWHLADQGAYERGWNVLDISRQVGAAHEGPHLPTPTATRRTRTQGMAPSPTSLTTTAAATSTPTGTAAPRPRKR
ncbi:hypothetical protein [Streptomyces sp. SID3343]|uniref:hypothetical protein n=1 Tax=Streptomyces sp. SID3343 TaxID=2690260 RepID=UPI0013680941|nr:hypothetical protein [Streptomyces sp. SID3343]MYW03383.1 hypothetical protein [Streptomyces sp. SID3343]MYW06211.1 hypothetical protein [Streptomyces sp. SID3343]